MVENNPSGILWAGRLKACLVVALVYLVLVCMGIGARLEITRWGSPLTPYTSAALRNALILHATGALLIAALLYIVRKININTPAAARFAMAALPILIFVSLDRLASTGYPQDPYNLNRYVPHPTRIWANRPNWVDKYEGVTVRINSTGMRGPEIPYAKVTAEQRILFLGDSVLFGHRTKEEDCFAWRIPHLSKTPLTVINAGVEGYSPWQEYDLLKSEGIEYAPDIIVQVFCVNDVLDKYLLVPFGGNSLGHQPEPVSILNRSGLYRMFRAMMGQHRWSKIELARQRKIHSFHRVGNDLDSSFVQNAWKTTLQNMDKIVTLARDSQIPLAIVCFPHSDQLTMTEPNIALVQETVEAFAKKAGVPFLDLLPAYRNALDEPSLAINDLFLDPLHATPLGHEIAAQHIYRFLADLNWIE